MQKIYLYRNVFLELSLKFGILLFWRAMLVPLALICYSITFLT